MKRRLAPREAVLLTVTICLAVVGLVYMVWFRPELAKVSELKVQVGQLRAMQGTLGLHHSPSPSGGEQSSTQTAIDGITLPKNPAQTQFVAELATLENTTHVQVTSLAAVDDKTPGSPAPAVSSSTSGLPNIHMTLHVQGTSAQLEAFLQALRQMPRLTTVQDVVVQGGAGGHTQADLDVLAYYAPA